MEFEVLFSKNATLTVDYIGAYFVDELLDPSAFSSFLADLEETIDRLTFSADSLPLCENKRVALLGYRKIHLKKHRFFLLYRINGLKVIVDDIFHNLEDFENKI